MSGMGAGAAGVLPSGTVTFCSAPTAATSQRFGIVIRRTIWRLRPRQQTLHLVGLDDRADEWMADGAAMTRDEITAYTLDQLPE